VDRSAELEHIVVAWFENASRGDASLVATHTSQSGGTRLIGSDPGEFFRGGSAVTQFLNSQVEGAAGNASFTPGDVEAFCEGTVGWATANLAIRLPNDTQVSPRWSGVFHMEDGVWKFVQMHVSIGISNEDVDWVYPS
jgi:adenylate cyclase